ncbi:MAG: 5'-3' exonuclease H3TH domain-containing protein [Microgenomates group bacterium]|nr:5'-3' exonuclease H3TH domain-containing protein [Microgenomates group bacterium]
MATLLLIDGNAVMHRAYHALPIFKTKKGIPTNVVFGFFSMLHKAINDFSPRYLIVCFDTPKPTFRNKLFAKYQAQRPKIVDEFKIQIPKVKEALDKAGITHLEKDGFEADDIIGSIAKKYQNSPLKVLILSGDKDILQLVEKNVYVAAPQNGLSKLIIFDKKEVEKKLGITPKKIVDYKALAGDPSDNYIGAKGIGPKTATLLINQFGSIENLFNNLNQVKNQKIKSILEKNKNSVLLGKQLAKIITDLPLDFDLKKSQFKGFNNNLRTYLLNLEMKTLVNRLFKVKKEVINNKDKNKENPPQPSLF